MSLRDKLVKAFEYWKKYQMENPDCPKAEDVENYGEECVLFLEEYTGVDFSNLDPV